MLALSCELNGTGSSSSDNDDDNDDDFQELVTRDFSGSDGTNLSDINSSNDWSVTLSNGSDTLRLLNNMAHVTRQTSGSAAPPVAIYKSAITEDNIEVSLDFEVDGGNINSSDIEAFVILRADFTSASSSSGSAYFCGFQESNTLKILKTTSGLGSLSVVASASTSITFDDDDEFEVEFVQDGSTLTCRAFQQGAGTASATYTDSSPLSGQYVGMAFGDDNGDDFTYADDFEVEVK